MRGIVAGNTLRRAVARTLSRQFAEAITDATAPFQFALQTRAGTEALSLALTFLTDSDPDAVVLSIDGIGAFDHVR